MKQINWGFIGCGEVTEKKSGPAFNEVSGSRVVAVMGRSPEKTRSYAQRHGIPKWFTDAQALVDDPEVNAVYIATPPSSHATYAIMAMHAGKPCYVEKPLAASYDDCARVNHVSQMTGVPCYVAYYRRYLPYFREVKNVVESGKIGKAINVQIRFSCPPRQLDYNKPEDRPWRLQPDIAGGGYFYDLAPHQLDLLQHLFGPVVEAQGYTANRGGLYTAEDTVAASMLFHSGMPASGTWSFVAHESAREDRILILGDGGQLSFSVFSYSPLHLINMKGEYHIKVDNPSFVQLPLLREIHDHLLGHSICRCDSVSATPTNWVMDRILGKI